MKKKTLTEKEIREAIKTLKGNNIGAKKYLESLEKKKKVKILDDFQDLADLI